jgi:hypothetical protein
MSKTCPSWGATMEVRQGPSPLALGRSSVAPILRDVSHCIPQKDYGGREA